MLRLLARGLSNQAIANELGIRLATVRNHVQSVIEKLRAHSKLEAVATATRLGMLSPRGVSAGYRSALRASLGIGSHRRTVVPAPRPLSTVSHPSATVARSIIERSPRWPGQRALRHLLDVEADAVVLDGHQHAVVERAHVTDTLVARACLRTLLRPSWAMR